MQRFRAYQPLIRAASTTRTIRLYFKKLLLFISYSKGVLDLWKEEGNAQVTICSDSSLSASLKYTSVRVCVCCTHDEKEFVRAFIGVYVHIRSQNQLEKDSLNPC